VSLSLGYLSMGLGTRTGPGRGAFTDYSTYVNVAFDIDRQGTA
jgi:hypothetical protein